MGALKINILNADGGAGVQQLPRPTADDFGASGYRALSQGAEALGHQLSIFAAHERQAIVGSIAAQAEAEYVGATAEATEQAYAAHPGRPDVAHQQALAFMQSTRQKIVTKYAQNDNHAAAAINHGIARHDIVTLPKLQKRTTEATVKNALDAAAAQRAAGIQKVVGGESPEEISAGMDQIVGGTMQFAGNATSPEQARDDIAAASQELANQLTEKRLRTHPLAVLLDMKALTPESPELEGLSFTERQAAVDRESKKLADAMIARHEKKRDLLGIDTQTAYARGLLTAADYLRVEKVRGATLDDAVIRASLAGMPEDTLKAIPGLSTETFEKALGNIHAVQDRAHKMIEWNRAEEKLKEEKRQQAITEAQTKTQHQFIEKWKLQELMPSAVLDSNLNPVGQGSKEHFLNLITAQTKELDTPVTKDPETFAATIRQIRRQQITSEDQIDALYFKSVESGRGIDWEDVIKLRTEFADMRTPDGRRLGHTQDAFLEGVKAQIDKSNPLMGKVDYDGRQKFYEFSQHVQDRVAAMRREKKDPHLLFTPSAPEYMGVPSVIAPYQKTLQESIRDMSQSLQEPPATLQASPKTAAPSQLKQPMQRQPGETIDQYLKRRGLK